MLTSEIKGKKQSQSVGRAVVTVWSMSKVADDLLEIVKTDNCERLNASCPPATHRHTESGHGWSQPTVGSGKHVVKARIAGVFLGRDRPRRPVVQGKAWEL